MVHRMRRRTLSRLSVVRTEGRREAAGGGCPPDAGATGEPPRCKPDEGHERHPPEDIDRRRGAATASSRAATRALADAAISVQTQVGSRPRPARHLLTAAATISPHVKAVGRTPTASRNAIATGAASRSRFSAGPAPGGSAVPGGDLARPPEPEGQDAYAPDDRQRRCGWRPVASPTPQGDQAGHDQEHTRVGRQGHSQRATPKSSDAEPTAE